MGLKHVKLIIVRTNSKYQVCLRVRMWHSLRISHCDHAYKTIPDSDRMATSSGEVRQRKFAGGETISISKDGAVEENVPVDTGLLLLCEIALGLVLILPVIFLILLIVLPNKINPVEYKLPDLPKLNGSLRANKHLTIADKLFEGRVIGPESLIVNQGHIYTGTADGKILHIEKGEIETVAELGKHPCGSYYDEDTCGRPLGMRFDADGYLIVLDAYLGLFSVNVATGDSRLLIDGHTEIGGREFKLLNDLDIDSNGDIYFTDSSKYQRRDFIFDMMEGTGTGRFLKYSKESGSVEILLDDLYFPNGVQFSKNKDFVLITETTKNRIIKYHLKGPQEGQIEIFVDNLPGMPDNIRPSRNGGYWVGIPICRYSGKLSVLDTLANWPRLRGILAKLPRWLIMAFGNKCGMVLEIDKSGNIIRSLMDLEASELSFVSEAVEDSGTLYLGSFREPYIAKLNLHSLRKS